MIGRLLRAMVGGMLRSLFDEDVDALTAGLRDLEAFTAEVGGGRIGPAECRTDGIYVPLVARDGERYVLRIELQTYLEDPPGCSFVGPDYEPADDAWPEPDPRGPFRSPAFICTPPTAEFYEYHPERRYVPGEGTLVQTVATVFAALHAPEYSGRSGDRRRPERRRRRR